MLELENYGKLIVKEEFVADTKTHEIIDGLYLGSDSMYFDGFVGLDISKIDKNSYKTIISRIKQTGETEEDGKIFETELEDKFVYTSSVKNLRSLLLASEHLNENGFDAPTLYTWESSRNKDSEYFTVNFNGIDINCPKEHNLLKDKYILLEYQKEKSFGDQVVDGKISEFYCHPYGLLLHRNDIFELQYYLNDENRLDKNVNAIVTEQYVKNPNISMDLPNLSIMVENILFYDNDDKVDEVEFRYDDDGLIKGGENCLYESYSIDGIRKPLFSTSLHPFYFDTFDTGLIGYNGNRFCIDQINRYLDDDLLEYTREIYEIDPEKKEELLEEIRKTKELNEHAIPTI